MTSVCLAKSSAPMPRLPSRLPQPICSFVTHLYLSSEPAWWHLLMCAPAPGQVYARCVATHIWLGEAAANQLACSITFHCHKVSLSFARLCRGHCKAASADQQQWFRPDCSCTSTMVTMCSMSAAPPCSVAMKTACSELPFFALHVFC